VLEETAAEADETEQLGSDYGLEDRGGGAAGDMAGSGDDEAARWDEAVDEAAAEEWQAPASADGKDARESAKQLAAQRRWEDLVREEGAAREQDAGGVGLLPETQTPPGYRDEAQEADPPSSHDAGDGEAAADPTGGVVQQDNGAGVGATQPYAADGTDDGGSGHGSDGTEVADDDDDDEEQLPCSQAELPWRRAPSKKPSAPDQVTSTPIPTLALPLAPAPPSSRALTLSPTLTLTLTMP
jgi:hypothetical protein